MKHTEYEFPDGTIIYAFSALKAFCIYNAQQIERCKPLKTFLEIRDEHGNIHVIKLTKV